MQIADLFARLTLKPDKKSFDAADKLLSGVKTALLGLAAVKTGEWLGGLIEATIDAGSAAHDTAQKLGITSTAVQQLQYAAKLSGTDIESVTTATGKMAKGLAEAKTKGTGPLVDGFALLGISMNEQAVQAGDMIGMHALIADKIKDDSIPAWKKQAAAMDIAGRGGLALIPLWSEGAKGIEAMSQEAVDLGFAMSEDANNGLESMGDDIDRVKMGLVGLRNTAVVALMPMIKELIDDTLAWVKANKQLLAQRLTTVLHGFLIVLRAIGMVLSFVVDVFRFFSKNAGFLIAIVAGLAGAFLILKAAAIGAAIASAIEWALAALPILLIAALITGLILIFEDLYTWIVGGDSVFKEFYESCKHWIGEKVAGVINFLIDGLNAVVGAAESVLKAFMRLGQSNAFKVMANIAGGGMAESAGSVIDQVDADKVHFNRVKHVGEGDWSGDPTRDEQTANMRARGMQQNPDGSWYSPKGFGGAMGGAMTSSIKIDVNVPPGTDTGAVANGIADKIKEVLGGQLRRVAGANGGNR